MMKKVYICAPLGGDVEGNLCNAKKSQNMRCCAARLRSCRIFTRNASMTVFRVNEKLEWRPD